MSTTIKVYDHRSTLVVSILDQRGERLSLSVPSGRHGGYPEARRRSLDEAIVRVRDHVRALRKTWPGAEVIGLDALDDADPELMAR